MNFINLEINLLINLEIILLLLKSAYMLRNKSHN